MKKFTLAPLLGLSLLATGVLASCNGNSGTELDPNKPQVASWQRVVTDLPFPTTGDGAVTQLTVGRLESMNNFANRGNIEIFFDQDADLISIEMRPYDFSDDITALGDEATDTKGTLERFSLWAFTSSAAVKPDGMAPEDNCTLDTWKPSCFVYAYYDGQSQPERSGVDLRVHLPKAYRGTLNVVTQDNLGEASYPRLGNVTIDGMCTSGTINIANGTANIKMCRELTPAPRCTAEAIDACDNWLDEEGNVAAWANACPCKAADFGQLRVEAVKPSQGNITIDIPTTTWLTANISNDSGDTMCPLRLDSCTDGICEVTDSNNFRMSGEFNAPPGGVAPKGGGFNVTGISASCGPVDFVASPDDWSADGEPMNATHGNIRICTDCL